MTPDPALQYRSMKIKKFFQYVFLVMTVAVMAVIFIFSSQNASSSSQTSGRVVRLILSVFARDFSSLSASEQALLISKYGNIVRKAAHFSEFAALGFSFSMYLRLKDTAYASVKTLTFGFLYAVLDELHQLFSEGRACSVRDVMIDTSGVVFALVVTFLIISLVKRIRQ